MAFCAKCGVQLADGMQFCPACGAPTGVAAPNQNVQNQQAATYQQPMQGAQGAPNGQPMQGAQQAANNFASKFTNTADTTGAFHPQDIAQNKAMGILAYLGILVLIPIFAAKESRFARYHANQGLVLAIAEVAYGIVYGILVVILNIIWPLELTWTGFHRSGLYYLFYVPLSLVFLVFTAAMILGIVNAATGKAKELPIIGKIKILK